MAEEVITNQPVVIDNGSGVLKAGFAGDEFPKLLLNSYVGRPKHVRVMAGAVEGDFFIGPKAEELRGLLKINYPIEHGIVTDWIDMEHIWNQAFDDLHIQIEDHPVLMTEAPLNPRKNRTKACEIMFETFNVPALFFSLQSVLALYASGKTTGVVLDSGDGVTHAVPVFEGFAMPHAIVRNDFAGRDITNYLQLLLRRAGHVFTTSAEREVVRNMKETVCFIAFDPHREEEVYENEKNGDKDLLYKLPDGNVIEIGPERFRAPEAFFQPNLVGEEIPGIHELLHTAIMKSDLEIRKSLYSSIVVSGGSTLFQGFGNRLLNEVKKLAPKDTKIKISAPPERKYSTWNGGSILASLTTFKKMWVSRAEFEEEGADVIHRKTF